MGSTGEPHVSAGGVRGAAPRPTPGSPRPPGTAQPWVPGQTRQLLWDRASHQSASLRPFRGSGQGTGNSHLHRGACTTVPGHLLTAGSAWLLGGNASDPEWTLPLWRTPAHFFAPFTAAAGNQPTPRPSRHCPVTPNSTCPAVELLTLGTSKVSTEGWDSVLCLREFSHSG